jgi:hypothetical protein
MQSADAQADDQNTQVEHVEAGGHSHMRIHESKGPAEVHQRCVRAEQHDVKSESAPVVGQSSLGQKDRKRQCQSQDHVRDLRQAGWKEIVRL